MIGKNSLKLAKFAEKCFIFESVLIDSSRLETELYFARDSHGAANVHNNQRLSLDRLPSDFQATS